MRRFIGRDRELNVLGSALRAVHDAVGAAKPGQCVLMRGRRRVGKSSLVEEFLRRTETPYLFFTAAGGTAEDELTELLDAVARSTLPERELFSEETPTQWNAALRLLAEILPDDGPSVVVIDEVPYLMERIDAFEGMLQRAWDRLLSRKPVLLLLVGSDLSMMETLNSYNRPFHQRGREMVVGPAESGRHRRDARTVSGGRVRRRADHRGAPPDLRRVAGRSGCPGVPPRLAGQPDLGAAGLRRALTGRGVPTAGDEQGGPAGHRFRGADLHQHRARPAASPTPRSPEPRRS